LYVAGFHEECDSEIDALKCGRLNEDASQPTEQGQTISCLQQNLDRIKSAKCKRQILRVTELQSSDFHLDRPLFFACREDRERFCGEVCGFVICILVIKTRIEISVIIY
jgi:Golgi apparatus protein 1